MFLQRYQKSVTLMTNLYSVIGLISKMSMKEFQYGFLIASLKFPHWSKTVSGLWYRMLQSRSVVHSVPHTVFSGPNWVDFGIYLFFIFIFIYEL